ncbi:MAG TPA: hypothetical protein VG714_05340 [Acidobacteriaceae bacterium]|nr:hypothetical protein [Acidobacteriaceae bacterium]
MPQNFFRLWTATLLSGLVAFGTGIAVAHSPTSTQLASPAFAVANDPGGADPMPPGPGNGLVAANDPGGADPMPPGPGNGLVAANDPGGADPMPPGPGNGLVSTAQMAEVTPVTYNFSDPGGADPMPPGPGNGLVALHWS